MVEKVEVNPAGERSLEEYDPTPVQRSEDSESTLTRLIERQAARIPSDVFLFLALGSLGASLALEVLGRRRVSRFVGMWPPTLLTMGVYNKLVKTLGPR